MFSIETSLTASHVLWIEHIARMKSNVTEKQYKKQYVHNRRQYLLGAFILYTKGEA